MPIDLKDELLLLSALVVIYDNYDVNCYAFANYF